MHNCILQIDSTFSRDGERRISYVKRKFSDFLWLRKSLVETFPDRIIPPLPRKRVGSDKCNGDEIIIIRQVVSSFAAAEVEGLRLVLELFLMRLTAEEEFASFLPFITFLTYSWERLSE